MAEHNPTWRNRIVGHGSEDAEQLLANPKNWRVHPGEQQEALGRVLDKVGWVQEVIVNQGTGFVVDGHLRVALSISRGENVPVSYVDLSEEEENLILATFDQITGLAVPDAEKLSELLADVKTDFPDLADMLDGLSAPNAPEATICDPVDESDADAVPDAPSEPVTRKGDIWVMGQHRLICGDCRDYGVIQRLFGDARANLVVTSPPYASQRKYDESSGFRPIPPDEYVEWFRDVAANIQAILADDGSYFLNIKAHADEGERNLYVMDLVLAHRRQWGWRFVDEFCWRKTDNGVPGGWQNRFKNAWEPVFHFCRQQQIKFRPKAVGHVSEDCFDYSPNNPKSSSGSGLLGTGARGSAAGQPEAEDEDGRFTGIARPSNVVEVKSESGQGSHSAPFPRALVEFFVMAFSDAGDIVFDPFMGSGSTLIAAEKNNRSGYGCELSPTYCDVIVRRWREFAGGTATLYGTGRTFDQIAAERLKVAA